MIPCNIYVSWVVATQTFFMFTPILGKISNLTHIFQRGWNHQPVSVSWPEETLTIQSKHPLAESDVKKISKSNERVVSADFFQSLDVRGLVNLSDFWSVSPWRRLSFWILLISGVSLYYDITDILTVLHNISILYYNAFFSLQLDACLGHWITGDVWVRLGSMWSFGMIPARQISTHTFLRFAGCHASYAWTGTTKKNSNRWRCWMHKWMHND